MILLDKQAPPPLLQIVYIHTDISCPFLIFYPRSTVFGGSLEPNYLALMTKNSNLAKKSIKESSSFCGSTDG
jgi:hypothetical protein